MFTGFLNFIIKKREVRKERCDGRYFRKIESKFCGFIEKNLSL